MIEYQADKINLWEDANKAATAGIAQKENEIISHIDASESSRLTMKQIEFISLSMTWERETRMLSSITEIATHPSYQKIIGMGAEALPMILHELKRKSGHWFWALKAISRRDPVPLEHRGRMEAMRQDWLNWGAKNGYV